MKKRNTSYLFFLVLALTVLTGVGCASSASTGGVHAELPDFVMNPPIQEDAIFGIGSAKLTTANQSLTMAEGRARQSLAFQLNANVQAMTPTMPVQQGPRIARPVLSFLKALVGS
ncbi:MAG: hypothetical protein LBD93_05120 [Treponema sp.]|jgi:hypothetical protein|nr:hypothetical protein [Treponema sp.]